jgi:hypothetical protein
MAITAAPRGCMRWTAASMEKKEMDGGGAGVDLGEEPHEREGREVK